MFKEQGTLLLDATMVAVKELLRGLDLGKSVAEFDEDLEAYFVETETFNSLVSDKIDIVAGDKGTGKTAVFRILQKRQAKLPDLKNIEILPAFNPTGASIFQKLGETAPLPEGEYIRLWKAYLLSLVGNWLLGVWGDSATPSMKQLDILLVGLELRDKDDTPRTIFQRVFDRVGTLFNWKTAGVAVALGPDGTTTFTPTIEFDKEDRSEGKPQVPIDGALRLLNKCLSEADHIVWVAIDRLDEAFQGYPDVEVPALRALLRSYLDLLEFDRVRLKLFVRRDLFRRVTEGGFVNLTHVNARKFEVIWDEEDLLNLLCRRIRRNTMFTEELGLNTSTDKEIFDKIFPDQVDFGKRKPKTWTWMMRRIRDGNDIKPPRNLIDLVSMAQQAQLRTEGREAREYVSGLAIVEPDALRRALSQLSETRTNDTLLAEARQHAPMIEKFRGGKAEHNDESLERVLGISGGKIRDAIKPLIAIGFLEEIRGGYKIPALYREGLEITQGKAFADPNGPSDEEDE